MLMVLDRLTLMTWCIPVTMLCWSFCCKSILCKPWNPTWQPFVELKMRFLLMVYNMEVDIALHPTVKGMHENEKGPLSARCRLCVSAKILEGASSWLSCHAARGKLADVPLMRIKEMKRLTPPNHIGESVEAYSLSPAAVPVERGEGCCEDHWEFGGWLQSPEYRLDMVEFNLQAVPDWFEASWHLKCMWEANSSKPVFPTLALLEIYQFTKLSLLSGNHLDARVVEQPPWGWTKGAWQLKPLWPAYFVFDFLGRWTSDFAWSGGVQILMVMKLMAGNGVARLLLLGTVWTARLVPLHCAQICFWWWWKRLWAWSSFAGLPRHDCWWSSISGTGSRCCIWCCRKSSLQPCWCAAWFLFGSVFGFSTCIFVKRFHKNSENNSQTNVSQVPLYQFEWFLKAIHKHRKTQAPLFQSEWPRKASDKHM